jgi:hypothetical protein
MTAIWKLHYTKMDRGKTIFFKMAVLTDLFGTVTHCSRLAVLQNGGSRPILFPKGEIAWDFWSMASGMMSGTTPKARKAALNVQNRNSATG